MLREAGGFEAFGVWYSPQKEPIDEWEGVALRSPSPPCMAAGDEINCGDLPRVARGLPVVSYPEFEKTIAKSSESPCGWFGPSVAVGDKVSSQWSPGTPVRMDTWPNGVDGQSIHEFFVVQGEDMETTELDRSEVGDCE